MLASDSASVLAVASLVLDKVAYRMQDNPMATLGEVALLRDGTSVGTSLAVIATWN